MTVIGTFTTADIGYMGTIETLNITLDVAFEKVPRKSSDKAPDFLVIIQHSGFEVGAAWQSKVPDTGAIVLSVKLDDPSFAEPINCRLIPAKEQGAHHLIWERNRKRG